MRLLSLLHFQGAVSVLLFAEVRSNCFLAALENEFSPIHQHLSFSAEEMYSETVLVLDGNPVGVNQFCATLGARFFRGKDFDRSAVVHAKAPLRDIEMVGAPVGDH